MKGYLPECWISYIKVRAWKTEILVSISWENGHSRLLTSCPLLQQRLQLYRGWGVGMGSPNKQKFPELQLTVLSYDVV